MTPNETIFTLPILACPNCGATKNVFGLPFHRDAHLSGHYCGRSNGPDNVCKQSPEFCSHHDRPKDPLAPQVNALKPPIAPPIGWDSPDAYTLRRPNPPQLSSERALELAASLDDPRIVQPDTEKATYLRAYASQSEQIEAFELIVLELKVLDLDIKRVCVENERLTRELDQAKLIRGEAVRLHASLVLESKQQAATIRQHEETIARLATHNGELRDEVREILRRCRTAEDERDAALRTVAELQRQFAHAIQTIGERDATIDQLTHENACLGVAVSDAEAKDRSDLAAADRINGELTRANASLRDRLDAVDGDRQAALRELEITFVRTEKTEARAAELDENLAALRRELDTARSDLSRVIVCAQHIEQVAQLTAALRSVKDLASGYTTGLAQDILDIVAPVLGTEGTK